MRGIKKKNLNNNKSNNKKWLKIWEKKGYNLKSSKFEDILNVNGHDSKLGKYNKKNWYKYIRSLVKNIKLNKNPQILEYGCGAGAFLSYWYKKKYNLHGIDYSKTLIKKCKKYYPRINVYHGKISTIKKIKKKFDLILSHSVFQYFDNYNYANSLILEMISNIKFKGYILILDVPDKEKEKIYKSKIKKAMGIENYKKHYGAHEHFFYKKSFFKKLAKNNNLNVKIFSHSLKFNENSKYRYNVIFKNNLI